MLKIYGDQFVWKVGDEEDLLTTWMGREVKKTGH
jgi:hypothetical protein